MRKIYLGVFSLTMIALILGCSANSSNDAAPVSYLEGEPVAITDSASAENAITSVSSLNSSGTSLSSSGTSLSIAKAPVLANSFRTLSPSRATSSGKVNCYGGGTVTYSDMSDTSGSVVYSSCNQNGTTINGSISRSGNTITMSNYSIVNNSDNSSFIMNMTITGDFSTGNDMTMTGTVSFKSTIDSGTFGYQNFRVVSNSDGKISISGDVSIKSSLYTCANGTFSIATLSPLAPNLSGGFSSGTMTINGVTMVFNNNNTVDVTYADGTTQTVNQGQDQTCN